MRNKTSSTITTVPLENKEAKAQLKQLYLDIENAKKDQVQALKDREQFLGAVGDKEAVLVELGLVKIELNKTKEEVEASKKTQAGLVEKNANLSQEIEIKEAKIKELGGINDEIDVAKNKLALIEQKKQELPGLEQKISSLNAKITQLETDYQTKAGEVALSLNKLVQEKEISEKKLHLVNSELEKINASIKSNQILLLKTEQSLAEKTNEVAKLASSISGLEFGFNKKFREENENLTARLQKIKDKFNEECNRRVKELDEREGMISEKIKWQEADRNYLQEVKKDLEVTYKKKINRVI